MNKKTDKTVSKGCATNTTTKALYRTGQVRTGQEEEDRKEKDRTGKVRKGNDRTELEWAGLAMTELDWTGHDLTGQSKTGLDWMLYRHMYMANLTKAAATTKVMYRRLPATLKSLLPRKKLSKS